MATQHGSWPPAPATRQDLPDSWLFSHSFWKRALGIVGHLFAVYGVLFAVFCVLGLIAALGGRS